MPTTLIVLLVLLPTSTIAAEDTPLKAVKMYTEALKTIRTCDYFQVRETLDNKSKPTHPCVGLLMFVWSEAGKIPRPVRWKVKCAIIESVQASFVKKMLAETLIDEARLEKTPLTDQEWFHIAEAQLIANTSAEIPLSELRAHALMKTDHGEQAMAFARVAIIEHRSGKDKDAVASYRVVRTIASNSLPGIERVQAKNAESYAAFWMGDDWRAPFNEALVNLDLVEPKQRTKLRELFEQTRRELEELDAARRRRSTSSSAAMPAIKDSRSADVYPPVPF